MVECHEMSQMTPTTMLKAAKTRTYSAGDSRVEVAATAGTLVGGFIERGEVVAMEDIRNRVRLKIYVLAYAEGHDPSNAKAAPRCLKRWKRREEALIFALVSGGDFDECIAASVMTEK